MSKRSYINFKGFPEYDPTSTYGAAPTPLLNDLYRLMNMDNTNLLNRMVDSHIRKLIKRKLWSMLTMNYTNVEKQLLNKTTLNQTFPLFFRLKEIKGINGNSKTKFRSLSKDGGDYTNKAIREYKNKRNVYENFYYTYNSPDHSQIKVNLPDLKTIDDIIDHRLEKKVNSTNIDKFILEYFPNNTNLHKHYRNHFVKQFHNYNRKLRENIWVSLTSNTRNIIKDSFDILENMSNIPNHPGTPIR